MSPRPHADRGAPKGNRNAYKHGLYSRSFKAAERKALDPPEGRKAPPLNVVAEIDALRVFISRALEIVDTLDDPKVFSSILHGVAAASAAYASLVRTQLQLDQEGYSEERVTIDQIIEGWNRELDEEKARAARGEPSHYPPGHIFNPHPRTEPLIWPPPPPEPPTSPPTI